MKKILFVFGTRPEAIKLAPVIKLFKKENDFDVKCCSTGQHQQLLEMVLAFFNIKVDFDLGVMEPNQTLGKLTSKIIDGLDLVLKKFSPDLVVIHGDTTTSFCGALTSFYNKIPVAHVEAGLRTNNKYSPFPEEINRALNGYLSTIHFAPTKGAVANLEAVKIVSNVILTGNTVVDSLQMGLTRLKELDYLPIWHNRVAANKRMILVTQHRRENFGKGIHSILQALLQISQRNDVQILFPVHLNPNVSSIVKELLSGNENIVLLEPLGYADLLWSMQKCSFIITDSGGIQEEAPSLGKPFLVTRETTERPEAIESGAGFLVGTNTSKIVDYSTRLLDDTSFYQASVNTINPYGDGNASSRILRFVKEYFDGSNK
ncbi:UDP-N-acetylglucosamine 2-epimerase (non-hydrolyzing) [Flammeovirgaceae bacterium]